ncbi:MAG: knotted carbamoyltransferase YgeW [Deltaproteobacteria bacterium]|jgi:knotted carbamoyltransferase YgeW|nr:knotted carbamoyltransferase YgeW [Deltaproteobacteria bacterium]
MEKNEILRYVESLSKKNIDEMYLDDFLLTWNKSADEIDATLQTAEILRAMRDHNISCGAFDTGLAISIFRDQSTRTRFSFASACNLLGLAIQELDEEKSQIAHGETLRETANMISFLTEVIGIRDDIYLGEGHTYMKKVARAVHQGHQEGILPQRPTLVNLQCDIDHPTQTMSDALHLINTFGGVENLKGKKIAMSWAYSPSYGKPLSVPQGIIGLMSRFSMDVVLAHPEGYNLMPEVISVAQTNSEKLGGSFTLAGSMEDAFKDADIVYPKSWAPYSVMEERTRLLQAGDHDELKALEKRCLETNKQFINWECTEKLMQTTRKGRALYMHCLPADISGVNCERGEVEASVFERYRVPLYTQAGYKPYVIAAMIFLSKFENPAEKLSQLVNQTRRRVLI